MSQTTGDIMDSKQAAKATCILETVAIQNIRYKGVLNANLAKSRLPWLIA